MDLLTYLITYLPSHPQVVDLLCYPHQQTAHSISHLLLQTSLQRSRGNMHCQMNPGSNLTMDSCLYHDSHCDIQP